MATKSRQASVQNSDGTVLGDVSKNGRVSNRFLLAVAVAKRAKQLKDGVKPLVPYNREEDVLPVETALKEIEHTKVQIIIKEKKEAQDELLEEMDQLLEAEMEEAIQADEDRKTALLKEKPKSKKSLAA
jgi:DNA-directed RNA polymerase omega subunit